MDFFRALRRNDITSQTYPIDKDDKIFKWLSSKLSFYGVILYPHLLPNPFHVDLFFIRGDCFVYDDIYRMKANSPFH